MLSILYHCLTAIVLARFARPSGHFYQIDKETSTDTYQFVVFSDPQYGKLDQKVGTGTGLNWADDIDHTVAMCNVINDDLGDDIDFIVATGDLAEAYPTDERRKLRMGSSPALRPAQTHDFINAMSTCRDQISVFTVPGNHDVGSSVTQEASWVGYEKLFMQSYYHFKRGERHFIALDSEVYKQQGEAAIERRQRQNEWLEDLFNQLPINAPKTVFMHTALFIESANETIASGQGESLPFKPRQYLLDLFAQNSVDSVFSGHTHFESFPTPYKGIQQYVLTSINYLASWRSLETGQLFGPDVGNNERGFYLVTVVAGESPIVKKILI